MSGFLDQYGVKDARKEKRRKRVILGTLAAIVLGVTGFLYFRTWSEERVVTRFFATLTNKDFEGAYRMFGCESFQKPCANYDVRRFNEDWGPTTPYSHGDAAKVANVDFCDDTVVFLVNYPNAESINLSVVRATKVLGFAPWPRCPGRHLQLRSIFDRLFGRS